MLNYYLLVYNVIYILNLTSGHICNHIYPRDHEVITGVNLDSFHNIKKRETSHPLRIKLSYDDSVYKLNDQKFEMITKHILPEAVSYWEKALMVRKSEKVIRLNRRCSNNQVFILREDPHLYCKGACEKETLCGEAVVPEDHLSKCRVCNALGHNCRSMGEPAGKGVPDADFVFYISALDTDRCKKDTTVAYAAHCQLEATLDRPIAGHANLCPRSISLKEQEMKTLISTVKHEILHALGFSVSLYAFFRDDDGQPLTERPDNGKPILNEKLQARQWSDRVIKTIVRDDWLVRSGKTKKKIDMVVTPRVVREVRNHFNCSSLEGAELEDQGHEGTALTHWEKRVFENEAMTGTHTQNPVYSRITLALMEDTGWYYVNYSMAQPLKWGANLGCDFAMRSCKHWIDTQSSKNKSIHPFCRKVKKEPLETECTDDRKSVALCNLVEYPGPLPADYQNFDSVPHVDQKDVARYGGSVRLADYCPYIQEFTWKSHNVVVRGSQCQFPENNPDKGRNFALESYSEGSRCFNHGQEWSEGACYQRRHWQHWGSGCYGYTCEGGRIHVKVANYTYTCFHANQVIPIKIFDGSWLHEGAIVCPPCSQLCEGGEDFCVEGTPKPVDLMYNTDSLHCNSPTIDRLLWIGQVIFYLLWLYS